MCFAAGKSSGSTLNTSGALAWALPTGLALCSCLVACQSDCGRTRRLMNRREFISLLGAAAAAWPLAARAQQTGKLPTVGFLVPGTAATHGQWFAALVQRLRDFGWIDGRNITVEYRWAEGRPERFAEIAAEFVRLKVDVIATSATGPTLAANQATRSIPIVFAGVADAVGSGLVTNLARPSGNVTGLSVLFTDLAGKRLELLREV